MSANEPDRRIAGVYDRLIEPMQAGERRVALDVVPPQPGWQVLDVGCGTGTGMAPYVAAGCRVIGVDVSGAMGFFRISNGEIAEMWGLLDTMGLLTQVGAMPKAPRSTKEMRESRSGAT